MLFKKLKDVDNLLIVKIFDLFQLEIFAVNKINAALNTEI